MDVLPPDGRVPTTGVVGARGWAGALGPEITVSSAATSLPWEGGDRGPGCRPSLVDMEVKTFELVEKKSLFFTIFYNVP